jgi:hypothetical protein
MSNTTNQARVVRNTNAHSLRAQIARQLQEATAPSRWRAWAPTSLLLTEHVYSLHDKIGLPMI